MRVAVARRSFREREHERPQNAPRFRNAGFDFVDVLLVRRKKDPFQGLHAFPGGFLEPDETAEVGVLRELQEETGIVGTLPRLFGAYSKPDRDPRGRTVTLAYLVTCRGSRWGRMMRRPPSGCGSWTMDHDARAPFAFDHDVIMSDALKARAREQREARS